MEEMEIVNGVIEDVRLGYNPNYNQRYLSMRLTLNTQRGHCILGDSIALDENVVEKGKIVGKKISSRMQMLIDVMDAVGVDYFDELIGKPIRVKSLNCTVKAIGNFIEDKWVYFS